MKKPWAVSFLAISNGKRRCLTVAIRAAATAAEALAQAEEQADSLYPAHFIWDLTMLDPQDIPEKAVYPDPIMDPDDFDEEFWEKLEGR